MYTTINSYGSKWNPKYAHFTRIADTAIKINVLRGYDKLDEYTNNWYHKEDANLCSTWFEKIFCSHNLFLIINLVSIPSYSTFHYGVQLLRIYDVPTECVW